MQKENKNLGYETDGQICGTKMATTTGDHNEAKEFVEGSSGSCFYIFGNGSETVFGHVDERSNTGLEKFL
jgi:hypothetical protein